MNEQKCNEQNKIGGDKRIADKSQDRKMPKWKRSGAMYRENAIEIEENRSWK